jgi:hypothetical protein
VRSSCIDARRTAGLVGTPLGEVVEPKPAVTDEVPARGGSCPACAPTSMARTQESKDNSPPVIFQIAAWVSR